MTSTSSVEPSADDVVEIGGVRLGNRLPMALIAGPCQMESRELALEVADVLVDVCGRLGVGLLFKTSFDKANRTSVSGERGLGLSAARDVFFELRERHGVPLVTDVHESSQCAEVSDCVDVLQIPAFLCRQTDLLLSAGRVGKAVNVKKGQFVAPWDVGHMVDKVRSVGNRRVMVTERGACFGYNALVSDPLSIPLTARSGRCPVVFDATHSAQRPGSLGAKGSGGDRGLVPYLASSAASLGIAAAFIETHPDPDKALSDGATMLVLKDMEKLLRRLVALDEIAKTDPLAFS